MAEQLAMSFPSGRGGRRLGAGRPRGTRRSTRIAHARRPIVSKHRPHHVTVRVMRGTWNLRSHRCFAPIRALLIRIAKGLNGVMHVRGRRFDDRYHEHVLKTPTEARKVLRYVLGNRHVHLARWGVPAPAGADPFVRSSRRTSSRGLRPGSFARAGPAPGPSPSMRTRLRGDLLENSRRP